MAAPTIGSVPALPPASGGAAQPNPMSPPPSSLPAGMGGKGARQENLAMGQKPAITGGSIAARQLGQYAKGPPAPGNPTLHPGAAMIRGSQGGISSRIKQGALGPGKVGTQGTLNTTAGAGANAAPSTSNDTE